MYVWNHRMNPDFIGTSGTMMPLMRFSQKRGPVPPKKTRENCSCFHNIRPPITNLRFSGNEYLKMRTPSRKMTATSKTLSSGDLAGPLAASWEEHGITGSGVWWFYRQLRAATLPSSSYGACPGAVGELAADRKQLSATTYMGWMDWFLFKLQKLDHP